MPNPACSSPTREGPTDARVGPAVSLSPELHVRLADGGRLHLRPLRAGESGPLLAVFEQMSSESRASRYLTGMTQLPQRLRERLVDLDGVHRVAWLASLPTGPVGIARYAEAERGTAEIAFEVVDEHQGRGIGGVLLDTLTAAAWNNGLRRVRATVLPGSSRSLRLIAPLGIPLRLCDGVLEGEGSLRLLDPPLVDRTALPASGCRETVDDPDEG